MRWGRRSAIQPRMKNVALGLVVRQDLLDFEDFFFSSLS